jgi:hypothetical protein
LPDQPRNTSTLRRTVIVHRNRDMRKGLSLLAATMLAVVAGAQWAKAAPPSRVFTVTVDLLGKGTVTSEPSGITCPSDCTQDYERRTNVVLTATPDYNSTFVGWTGACSGSQTTCTLTVTSSVDVAAVFEQRYPAPVANTGQTRCYTTGTDPNQAAQQIDCAGTGEDGEYQAGVQWPNPRFTDNGNGTVRDNLTGLIWLRDAGCIGPIGFGAAFSTVKNLAAPQCGLSDGSSAGDWRVPNVNELQSLVDRDVASPALPPGHPFVNVKLAGSIGGDPNFYASSTFVPQVLFGGYEGTFVWGLRATDGAAVRVGNNTVQAVWPVRGP